MRPRRRRPVDRPGQRQAQARSPEPPCPRPRVRGYRDKRRLSNPHATIPRIEPEVRPYRYDRARAAVIMGGRRALDLRLHPWPAAREQRSPRHSPALTFPYIGLVFIFSAIRSVELTSWGPPQPLDCRIAVTAPDCVTQASLIPLPQGRRPHMTVRAVHAQQDSEHSFRLALAQSSNKAHTASIGISMTRSPRGESRKPCRL